MILRILLTATLCSAPLRAQEPARPIPTASLAGQRVAVLPLTLVVADPALKSDSLYAKYRDRQATLRWADSLLSDALTERGPEVKWVLPSELRKLARRSPGIVKNPDDLGQAVLRSSRLRDVPDPLRSDLRNLIALAGGRVALVPAALGFGRDADGRRVRADLSLVLVDARTGKVLWRTLASGTGDAPDAALTASLAAVLPLETSAP